MHQYKMKGYDIVVDTNSGSIHIVDDLAYDLIKYLDNDKDYDQAFRYIRDKYKTESDEDIWDCISDIKELEGQGKLFSKDRFENLGISFKNSNTDIKALCLHVAHTCNLTCDYCFAGQGKFDGKEDALMTLDVAKRAIDFLIENSGNKHNLEVDFFGGEPLLNWELCKETVKYARSKEKEYNKNFRFTLTTNGMLINDDVIDFTNKEMYNVVLSLDGRKEVHDRYRTTRDGRGSFDRIVPKFQKLVDKRKDKNYYIRGTYTGKNLDFTEDIKTMVDLGFSELSLEPVVTDKDSPNRIKDEDLDIIYEQYDKLSDYILDKEKKGEKINFYHFMIDLLHGPCIYKRIKGCGVGSEYMAVTPSGDLYPCHQFVGKEDFKLGNIYDGIEKKELREEFMESNLYKHKECKNCWARLFCAGGCKANAFNQTGDINGVFKQGCDIFRKRMECAIYIKIKEAEMLDGEEE